VNGKEPESRAFAGHKEGFIRSFTFATTDFCTRDDKQKEKTERHPTWVGSFFHSSLVLKGPSVFAFLKKKSNGFHQRSVLYYSYLISK
jgi:hypothetical protein